MRLLGQKWWLLGTLALLTGYLFQAGALDRGRLTVIQPLLVTTVVFALPLGYLLTKQHVGRREVIGATVIIVGLGLFVYFADPAGGNEQAPNGEWAIAIAVIVLLSAILLSFGTRGGLSMKAAVYGATAASFYLSWTRCFTCSPDSGRRQPRTFLICPIGYRAPSGDLGRQERWPRSPHGGPR